MSNIKNPMTAQTPSAFGMPISGPAMTGSALGHATACTTAVTTSVVRDRSAFIGAVKGADQGVALGYFPGTTAWRPPNC